MRHFTALLVLICWKKNSQFLDICIDDLLKCVPAAFQCISLKCPVFHCWAGFNKTVFLSQYSQLLQICSGLAEPVPPVLHNSEVSSHSKDPLLRRWTTQQWTVLKKMHCIFFPSYIVEGDTGLSWCLQWTLSLFISQRNAASDFRTTAVVHRKVWCHVGFWFLLDGNTLPCLSVWSWRFCSVLPGMCECNSHENEAQSRFFSSRFDQL